MRILHLIDSSGMYGAEIMLLNLMIEQQTMECSPVLLSMGRPDEQEKQLEIECRNKGLMVRRIRIANNFNIVHNIKLLLQIVVELNIKIVHSHGYKGNILLGLIPGWKRRFPIVCTLHGWTATRKFTKMWLYEKLDKFCIQRFDAMVLVTSGCYGKCTTIQYSPEESLEKVFLVENGIPELSFDADSGKSNQVLKNNHEFLIGAIGRLSPEKGFGYLVDAMVYLLKDNDNYKLIIFGEGGERQHLEKKVSKYGLQGKIVFPGYYDNAYLYLKNFDVFIMPSLTEGLPITLLEAMQAGLPIIASRVGGIPEVIEDGHTGLLVDPKDSNELSQKIAFIRNNPDKGDEIGRRARQVALQKYSSRRMAEEYKKVYSVALGAQRCGKS